MQHEFTFCFRMKYESSRSQPSIAEMHAIAEQIAEAARAAAIAGLVTIDLDGGPAVSGNMDP
jgi:hypothetical protein